MAALAADQGPLSWACDKKKVEGFGLRDFRLRGVWLEVEARRASPQAEDPNRHSTQAP